MLIVATKEPPDKTYWRAKPRHKREEMKRRKATREVHPIWLSLVGNTQQTGFIPLPLLPAVPGETISPHR
jgi:hypothetical protein